MSNHIHIIAKSKLGKLSDTIRDFKSFTTKCLIREIWLTEESRRDWMITYFKLAGEKNSRNSNSQIWIQDNHPIELDTNKMIDDRLSYVHFNPVESGIVNKPEEYVYSSASNYAYGYGIMDVELIV